MKKFPERSKQERKIYIANLNMNREWVVSPNGYVEG